MRLSPAAVAGEVDVLQQFVVTSPSTLGIIRIHLRCVLCCIGKLIAVLLLPEMVFSNGCRAPPWRQAHGDIRYLQVKPQGGGDVLCDG